MLKLPLKHVRRAAEHAVLEHPVLAAMPCLPGCDPSPPALNLYTKFGAKFSTRSDIVTLVQTVLIPFQVRYSCSKF